METKFFVELEEFYYKDIEFFKLDEIKFLIENNILQIKSNHKIKKEKTDYNNDIFSFKYVGALSLSENIIMVLPKYLNDISKLSINEKKEKSKLVIKVIRKYLTNNIENGYIIDRDNDNSIYNRLYILDLLMEDFLRDGLYENRHKYLEKNGSGEINWDYTINRETGYISNRKNIVYFDYYSTETESQTDSILRELQKYFLNKASSYFEELSFLDFNYPNLNFNTRAMIEENKEYLIGFLDRVLTRTFSARVRRLIKIIKILIEEKEYTADLDINLYGTTSFHVLWEDICKKIYGDMYDKQDKYKDIIKKYTSPKYSVEKSPRAPMRPDIVFEKDDILFILDAKYYNVSRNEEEEKLRNSPGTYDVIKQFVYAQAFNKEYKGKKKINAFILPGNSIETLGVISNIEVELFGEDEILVQKIPAEAAYKLYLNDREEEKYIKELIDYNSKKVEGEI